MLQPLQMKGQRRRRDREFFGQFAGRMALRATANQQTEHAETRFLGESPQGCDGVLRFHDSIFIEMRSTVKICPADGPQKGPRSTHSRRKIH